VIGNKKQLFLEECQAALKNVECRDVRDGSIILTIRGDQADVNSAVESLVADGLALESFTTFIVTADYAANNTEVVPADSEDKFYEDQRLFVLIGIVVVLCCIVGICCYRNREKYVEVIDLADVQTDIDVAKLANFSSGEIPEEGSGTPGGHLDPAGPSGDFIEMQTPGGNTEEVTPGEGIWKGNSEIMDMFKRTPGMSAANFGAEGHLPKLDAVDNVKRQASRQEVEDGLFGKEASNEGNESRVGGAAFDSRASDPYKVGGAEFNPESDLDDDVDGLYVEEGRDGRSPTGANQMKNKSVVFEGEGFNPSGSTGAQKRNFANANKDEGTRISLSITDDSDELFSVQHLYDTTVKTTDSLGPEVPNTPRRGGASSEPSRLSSAAGLELPITNTELEHKKSLKL